MEKVIVITGTSSGFGTLMVRKFAAEGYTVIATMRDARGRNLQIAEELDSLPDVEVMELDVAEDTSVKTTIAKILEKYNKIDVFINNAGIQGTGLLEAYSVAQFHKIMNTNVYGILRVYQEILPAMRKEQDGLIINISSNAGRFSPPFQVPYNSSKFALESITEGGYEELIGQGIETVLIEPGAFMTEMYTKEGTHSDIAGIQEQYGEDTAILMTGFGAKLGGALQKYQPSPVLIVNAALRLIKMDKGTRPLRTSVDPIADGVDEEYNRITAELKKKWVSKYLDI